MIMQCMVAALVGLGAVVGAETAVYADLWPVDADVASAALYPTGPAACWPLPPWYPRSWEVVEHTPCPPGYYLPPRFHHARYDWRSHRHYSTFVAKRYYRHVYAGGYVHQRPYLRPGWWW
jgi:hypothetical protein